jgi:hypothetical protein
LRNISQTLDRFLAGVYTDIYCKGDGHTDYYDHYNSSIIIGGKMTHVLLFIIIAVIVGIVIFGNDIRKYFITHTYK